MDIILMLYFSFRNYKLAKQLEENAFRWFFNTFLTWFLFELAGIIIYTSVAHIDLSDMRSWANSGEDIIIAMLFGLACGYLGNLMVKRALLTKYDRKP